MTNIKPRSRTPRKLRTRRNDIASITTSKYTIEILPSQWWCETGAAFEIWDKRDGLDYRVKRIPRSSVLWVALKEEKEPQQ